MLTNPPSQRIKAVTVFVAFSILAAVFYPAYSVTCRPANVTSAHNCALKSPGGGEPEVCRHANNQTHTHSGVINHRHRHVGSPTAHKHGPALPAAHQPDTFEHKHGSTDQCN